jgi:UDP-2,4-diacetamido-2,4,6-trideoxy-beta-L-altropyranose hydrolase
MVMSVAIRVDASMQIGTGHVRRCLSLAESLQKVGANVAFVTRDLGVPFESIAPHQLKKSVFVLPSPSDESIEHFSEHAAWARVPWQRDAQETCDVLEEVEPDWLLIDHYAFDRRWHDTVKSRLGVRLCVVDDLADRPLDAEVIVDHNIGSHRQARYAKVAPSSKRLLCGPRFALLSAAYRDAVRCKFREPVQSIGIFMGGTDPSGVAATVLSACRQVARFRGEIQVVSTSANSLLSKLQTDCKAQGAELLVDLPDLSNFFACNDVQVGAGGGAALERCSVGAPTLALVCATNQREVVEALAGVGAVLPANANTLEAIGAGVVRLLTEPELRRSMGDASRNLVDGRGCERVAVSLAADRMTLRLARRDDAETVYGWRNDERTRRHSRNSEPITRENHVAWWHQTLTNHSRRLLLAYCGSIPVGTLRLDMRDESAEVSIYIDPELTGIGLGRELLRKGQQWVIQNEPTLKHVCAEILSANLSSAATFASQGFRQIDATHWKWEIH